MNEPHERVVRESELQGVWSAYPGGPAAISHRPDPIEPVADDGHGDYPCGSWG